jgi:hypothetical protein
MNLKTIKMQNLTVQQKSLVDSLVAEFTTLNNAKVVKSNLIDISGILDKITRRETFEKEVTIRTKMYKDKLTQRIIDDVNSIKADLKQLGLNIVGENSNVHIYCSKLAFINARKTVNIFVIFNIVHHITLLLNKVSLKEI